MAYVFPGDYWLTSSMQSAGEWLTPFMEFFTWLGYPQAYMIIIAIIYWSVDRKLGIRLSIFLPLTASLNSILKQAMHAPRPFWLNPEIKAIRVSNGFGMPSGHAQAACVWIYAAALIRRRWFWVIATFTVIMVGLSRIYLGVHFSSQVLIGWAIGIGIVLLFIRLESSFLKWFLDKKIKDQVFLIFGITLIFLTLGLVFVFILRSWEVPAGWISNAADDLAGRDETIRHSIGMGSVAGNAGGFLGTALGALFSHRNGGFKTGGKWWIRILRSILGLLIILSLFVGFNSISPGQTQDILYPLWRFSGFFVIAFSSLFLIPLFFERIKLMEPSNNQI